MKFKSKDFDEKIHTAKDVLNQINYISRKKNISDEDYAEYLEFEYILACLTQDEEIGYKEFKYALRIEDKRKKQ